MFFRIILCVLTGWSVAVTAQPVSAYILENQLDSIITYPDTILLIDQSVQVTNQGGAKVQIQHIPEARSVRIFDYMKGDTFRLFARRLPLLSRPSISILDSNMRRASLPPDYAREGFELKSTSRDWWTTPGVNYTGNFSRGLSAGNNQSLVLNSALNLQMSGDLGDQIRLTGAISDNQIPIQPEGNTRQIQDFDKLFIQISRKNIQMTAGDFQLERPAGYFMNYFKKTKGGLFESQHQIGKWNMANRIGFAISKGKNQRINLETQNGNQGPYRLRGRDSESFIIVLAASEKIWIDGILMTRGDDADYVIDYNLGEITFTPRRIISDQTRVIVEFEYAVQNYIRTLSVGNFTAQKKNWQTYLNVYLEQDSKKPTVNADLDSLDKAVLSQSGDDPSLAVRSGIRRSGTDFNANRIYYQWKDTNFIFQSQLIPIRIIEWEEKPDSNSLQVGFSERRNGNYRLKLSNGNGRVYEWISPDPITGEGRGNYDPLIPIPAPQQTLLMNGGVAWQGKNDAHVSAEAAMSSLDRNRLSAINDNDNVGAALKFQAKTARMKLFSPNFSSQLYGQYEFNDKQFQVLNPYRNTEFLRDWNVGGFNGFRDHIINGGTRIFWGKHLTVDYEASFFQRNSSFEGLRHKTLLAWSDSLQNFQVSWNLLNTNDSLEDSRFSRPGVEWTRKFGKQLQFMTKAFREKNERFSTTADSLKNISFFFDQWENQLSFLENERFNAKIKYQLRKDYQADSLQFNPYSLAQEFSLQTTIPQSKIGSFDMQIGGRYIRFDNEKINDSLGQFYFLGLFDHQIQLWKQAVRLKNYYELQSGVEPRQEFVFEEQRQGQGDYIFQDFNGDGIRQVQEYIYAPDIDTANFVRLQLFNTEYVPVYQNSWNQFVNIDLNRWIKSQKKSLRFIKKISFESNFRLNNKLDYSSNTIDRLNPLIYNQNDLSLISFQRNNLQQFFINRAHQKYEFLVAYNSSSIRSLLTSGNDERIISEWSQKLRLTFFKKLDATAQFALKSESRFAPLYADQNYKFDSRRWEAGVQYRIRPDIRLQFQTSQKFIEELAFGGEKANVWQWFASGQSVLWKKLSIRAEAKWLQIDFQGKRGSAVEFVMLEGFKDGNNASWDLQLEYKLSKSVQIQLSYTGRKAAELSAIHTGRAQLRANF